MKVLFSCYNPAGYQIAGLKKLAKLAEVYIFYVPTIRLPVSENTVECVSWIDRTTLTRRQMVQMVEEIAPDLYVCGGWANKDYLAIAKKCSVSLPCVLLMDTPWRGDIKQWAHCIISRLYLVRNFSYVWCAGQKQKEYARRLGFNKNVCRLGCYCADTDRFLDFYERRLVLQKSTSYPKTFLYVGRYVPAKNMRRMERAFLQALEKAEAKEWRLVCIGTGDLWSERTQHPSISHLGYKHPDEMGAYVKDAGVFVLPSLFEPWGVVVHEFAVMGLPILCSSSVCSAEVFVRHGVNGYVFNPLDEEAIRNQFLCIMQLDDARLTLMSENSHRLGMSYTTDGWAEQILSFNKHGLESAARRQ